VRFSEDLVRAMGRSAAGVRGMKLREGDEVVSCAVTRDDADILSVSEAGYGKRTKLDKYPAKGRGTMGVKGIKLIGRKGATVVAARMVTLDDEVIIVSNKGQTIRTAARDISTQGRDASGVRVMNVADDEQVVALAPVFVPSEDNGKADTPPTLPVDAAGDPEPPAE
jgi:DNA gyrase subunit A